jgi:hypothetical protein
VVAVAAQHRDRLLRLYRALSGLPLRRLCWLRRKRGRQRIFASAATAALLRRRLPPLLPLLLVLALLLVSAAVALCRENTRRMAPCPRVPNPVSTILLLIRSSSSSSSSTSRCPCSTTAMSR